MLITKEYTFFYKDKIAQWNMKSFQDDTNIYCCAEQYMMYHKAILFNDLEIADRIMRIRNVKQIKQLGREVKNFDNQIWDENKFDIVVKGNFLKFNKNPNFKKELYKYKDKEFVEASPVDRIWGIGLHYEDDKVLDKSKWKGQNLLGKAINKVKEMLFEKEIKKEVNNG